jgi:thiamine biosynthesis lipoprotein
MNAVVNLPAGLPASMPMQAGWFEREEAIMGTRIAVQLWAASAREASEAIDAVMADMHRTDRLMSTYKPESQLSQVNAHAFERPVEVDPDIIEVLLHALEYSRLSDGAFDVTYASVGHLYDYRHRQRPCDAQIEAALQSVDYRQVEVDRQRCTVRFHRPGMRIDFGGIAKGWACDRGVAILRRLGIAHGMVNAGGDTTFLGDRRGKPWIVGIQDPRNREAVVARIPLADEAISTSGDYERYFDHDGTRHHHILVPGTGKSPHAVHSVTVVGPNATRTDGLTKTVFILGAERGLEFIERLGDVEAVVVDAQGCMHASKGFSPPD